MDARKPEAAPRTVLFACGFNAVRSPMAAALARRILGEGVSVVSAGVRKETVDAFAVAAMAEIGIDISEHEPVSLEELEHRDANHFDLIVTLAPEAHHAALALAPWTGAAVEYWQTGDPTAVEGNREQRLDAYRAVRDQLVARIAARFAPQRMDKDAGSPA